MDKLESSVERKSITELPREIEKIITIGVARLSDDTLNEKYKKKLDELSWEDVHKLYEEEPSGSEQERKSLEQMIDGSSKEDLYKLYKEKLYDMCVKKTTSIPSGKKNELIKEYVNVRMFEHEILLLYKSYTEKDRKICHVEDEKILKDMIKDKEIGKNVQFGIFLFLVTSYRREDHPDDVKSVVDKYKIEFSGFYICPQYELLAYTNVGIFEEKDVDRYIGDCKRLLEDVRKNNKHENDFENYNSGAINAIAEVVASFAERQILQERDKPLIKEYIDYMNTVVRGDEMNRYSSFYSTLGRLYAQDHLYKDARKWINKAINDDKTNQRATRVVKWRSILVSIDTDEKTRAIRKDVEEQNELYKKQAERNVLTLSMLAGFIGLIVGSMNIASNIELKDAAMYIITFTGCIVICVGLMSIILMNTKKSIEIRTKNNSFTIGKDVIVLIIGTIVVVLGICISYFT